MSQLSCPWQLVQWDGCAPSPSGSGSYRMSGTQALSPPIPRSLSSVTQVVHRRGCVVQLRSAGAVSRLERERAKFALCIAAWALLDRITTMATPSPNSNSATSSNNSNIAGSTSHHHLPQSQHLTTVSSMQGRRRWLWMQFLYFNWDNELLER